MARSDDVKKHSLRLKKGEAFDADFAIDLLVEFDFERVDFVYEPGQFSIRGGIVIFIHSAMKIHIELNYLEISLKA
ncbi:MAG: hypothetical protein RMJ53_07185 [Chitinophagales bacterium]|nr:hypothetical protein [Chitinophagales bacterium]